MKNEGHVRKHSITPPHLGKGRFHRPRLVTNLEEKLQNHLILVAAPAGYGKTTFLADFTGEVDRPVCWVRLNSTDRDPMRLSRLVWASLQQKFHRLKGKLELDSHAGATPQALASLIAAPVSDLVHERFVLLFDDIHHLRDSASALELINGLLDQLPQRVCLILAGREVPRIRLMKWIVEDELKTIGPEELSFDLSELQGMVEARRGSQLSRQRALALLEATGGWAAGILLSDEVAADKLPMLVGEGRERTYRYLADAAFDRQPDELQLFLMDSAVMPMMTVESCDEVLERDDSGLLLARILRRGLFLSVTGDRPRAYEFHHLFRGFLLDRAHEHDRERVESLRIRAAEYFIEHDWPELAFDLYLQAGALARAVAVAEANVRGAYERGEDETLTIWAERLWEQGGHAPHTFRRLANVSSLKGDRQATETWLARAESAARSKDDSRALFAVLISRVDCMADLGIYDGWREVLDEALSLSSSERLSEMAAFHSSTGRLEFEALGAPSSALKSFEIAFRSAQSVSNQRMIAITSLNIGLCHAVLGNLTIASTHFERAHALGDKLRLRIRLPTILNNIAYLAYLNGDTQTAQSRIEEALRISSELGRPVQEAACALTLGDILRDRGQVKPARFQYRRALQIFKRLGAKERIPLASARLSSSYRYERRRDEALDAIKAGLGIQGLKHFQGIFDSELAFLAPQLSKKPLSRIVWDLLEDEQGSVSGKTQAAVLLALKSLAERSSDAFDRVKEALDLATTSESLQILAVEALAYPKLMSFMVSRFSNHPALVEIRRRVGKMDELRRVSKPRLLADLPKGTVQVLAFGGIRVIRDGGEKYLKPLHSEILVRLVDTKRVPKESLCDDFWPGVAENKIRSNLHSAVYAIRSTLGRGIIESIGMEYRINPQFPIGYDVEDFERVVESVQSRDAVDLTVVPLIEEALNMASGQFMAGYYSEWVLDKRRLLERMKIQLTHKLARLLKSVGQLGRGIGHFERALRIDPYGEKSNLNYMLALNELGRTIESNQHFLRFRKLLAEDLGIEPSDAILDVYVRSNVAAKAHHPGAYFLG